MEITLNRNGNPCTYTATLRYVPETIGIMGPEGKYYPSVPVTGIVAHAPGNHPKESCVFSEMHAVEIKTPFGSRWYGATCPFIDSSLRMVMDCNDRDEVLARWDEYNAGE
jgi:hypothetical protein